MPVNGVKSVQANYRKVIRQISQDKAQSTLIQIGVIAAGYAKRFTPIEYNTLVNNQFRDVSVTPRGWRLTVGYVAAYAAALEIRTDWQPRPPEMKEGPAWNPNAKPGFLQAGFEDSQPKGQIENAIARGMKI